MLFDLTGRGRRRTVRIVYGGLALLFLLGFVGFGVGSFGGGGIAEILGGNNGSSGSVSYESQVKKAKKLTEQQPNNAAAWSGLIHATLLQAGTGDNYNNTEGVFTPKAQPLLLQVQQAWQRYLKLNPHHPSPELATEVFRVYTAGGGLRDPAAAVRALKIEIAGRSPSATLYYELAVLAYQAHDKREGDLAAKKAIKLAPPGEETILKNYLAKAKTGATAAASGAAAAGQTVTVPASSLPNGVANGKTVTVTASALPKGITQKGATTGAATTTAPAGKPPGK